MYEVAKAVSAIKKVPAAPPIFYGPSMTHKNFGGTLSVKPETLFSVVLDVCSSLFATGFNKILLLNGHVPNEWVLKTCMDVLRAEAR